MIEVQLDDLTTNQKNNLIKRLAYQLARVDENSSALMYAKNGEVINRILNCYIEFKDYEINLDGYGLYREEVKWLKIVNTVFRHTWTTEKK